jgi:hypothetical protein
MFPSINNRSEITHIQRRFSSRDERRRRWRHFCSLIKVSERWAASNVTKMPVVHHGQQFLPPWHFLRLTLAAVATRYSGDLPPPSIDAAMYNTFSCRFIRLSGGIAVGPIATSNSKALKTNASKSGLQTCVIIIRIIISLISGVASYGALGHVPPLEFWEKNYGHI